MNVNEHCEAIKQREWDLITMLRACKSRLCVAVGNCQKCTQPDYCIDCKDIIDVLDMIKSEVNNE